MKYVLDTNVCIRILNGSSKNILAKIIKVPNEDIFIPTVVKFELYYGAFKSLKKERTLEILGDFLTTFNTIDFNDEIAEIAGKIRADLDKKGQPIGPYDLLIASSALSGEYSLVTNNTKEFSRIENLVIEDWEI